MLNKIKSALIALFSKMIPRSFKDWVMKGRLRKYFVPSAISHETASEKRARLRAGGKPELFHLDLHISDHCNLNCKGCENYSSISKDKFVDFDVVKRDLERMAELFSNIEEIYLVGGEPLLHERIADFIYLSRETFPRSGVYVMTNGILVTRMAEDIWKAMHETGAILLCDSYPINIKVDEINALGEKHGVKVEWTPKVEEFFKVPLDLNKAQDGAKSFVRCRGMSNCATLDLGKLYGCSHIAYSHILQDEFPEIEGVEGLTPTPADYVDIYSDLDGDQILERLMSPVPWCSHCAFDSFVTYEWGRTSKDPNEWFLLKDMAAE